MGCASTKDASITATKSISKHEEGHKESPKSHKEEKKPEAAKVTKI